MLKRNVNRAADLLLLVQLNFLPSEHTLTHTNWMGRVLKWKRKLAGWAIILDYLMFIGPCIIVIVEERKSNLMSLAILFHFLCTQHVSDINIPIIRSLRLCCWITTLVVLFSVRCVLEIWCGWFWMVFVLQAETRFSLQTHNKSNRWHHRRRQNGQRR